MAALFDLPNDVFAPILTNFIALKDVARLDSAVASRTLRPKLLTFLSSDIAFTYEYEYTENGGSWQELSAKCCKWLVSRDVKLDSVFSRRYWAKLNLTKAWVVQVDNRGPQVLAKALQKAPNVTRVAMVNANNEYDIFDWDEALSWDQCVDYLKYGVKHLGVKKLTIVFSDHADCIEHQDIVIFDKLEHSMTFDYTDRDSHECYSKEYLRKDIPRQITELELNLPYGDLSSSVYKLLKYLLKKHRQLERLTLACHNNEVECNVEGLAQLLRFMHEECLTTVIRVQNTQLHDRYIPHVREYAPLIKAKVLPVSYRFYSGSEPQPCYYFDYCASDYESVEDLPLSDDEEEEEDGEGDGEGEDENDGDDEEYEIWSGEGELDWSEGEHEQEEEN